MRTPCLNSDFQLFFDLFNFLPFTILADIFRVHNFTFSFTFTAFLGGLGVHSRAQLDKLFDLTSSFTFGALGHILTSFTIASFTISSSRDKVKNTFQLQPFSCSRGRFIQG
jgi:hypothetical protein